MNTEDYLDMKLYLEGCESYTLQERVEINPDRLKMYVESYCNNPINPAYFEMMILENEKTEFNWSLEGF